MTGGPFFPTANSYWLVNNGNASLTWRVSSNQSWITLSSTSGTILAGGTFSLTASINAAANSLASGTYGAVITFTDLATGVSQTQQISLFITSPNPVLSVTPASGFQTTCPSGGSWAPSSATYTILNSGNAQMSWSVSHSSTWIGVSPADGTLAAGGTSSITVNITSSANTLSAGNYTDTLAFTNLSNGAGNTTIPVTLTQLPPPPVITSGSTTTGSQGNPFSYQVNASNHPTGFTANGLPAGLVIDSASGMISGTPINAGTSTVTVSASNAGGTGNSTLMILVWPSPPVITCASSAVGYKNISFSFSITATNGPTDFTAPGLPDGLSLNAATGVISGTPTATGTANVVIGASNATGSGTAALQLVILATPPPVTAFYYVGVGWVSGGGSQFFTTANSTITASNNYDNGVSMSIITPGYADWWYLDFAAQGNDPLTTGTYLGATRFPFQTGTPGLSFDGDGRGDNTLTGYFNVLDIVYLSGSVFSFAADFVQFDEGNTSQWTMGSIRYNSIVPIRMNLMPDIGGVSAIGFTANSELINATINPNGFSTNWSIRYGPDAAYGYNTPTQSISRGVGGISVGGILTGLLANTTYHYQVVAASSSGTSTSQDLTFTTLATTPSAPIITSAAAATANQSQEFSYQITATNNPIAYSASGLPAGLSLDPSTGLISGSPVGSGVYQVTLAAMNGGGSGNMVLTLTSLPPPPVIIGSLSQTGGVGVAFNYQIQALNNPSSYVASGLPAGLSINGATGLISGTPTQTVTSNATISASNAGGTGSANLAITVITIPSITSSTSTSIAQGHSFSYQIKANNNPSAYNAVGLPPGLSCNASTGLISGTPSANGLTCVTISATNAGGTGNAPLLINVIPAVPVITSGTSAAGGINVRFLYTIAANNNASSFNASGLPAGLSINTATGLISGTPTSTGTSNVIISADNFVGTGTANLTIIISLTPPPVTAFYYYGNGYVAQGQSTYYSTDTGSSITASINYDKGVSLSVNGPYGTDWWYLDFAAPGNVPLTTGTFPGAARFPFQAGSAGLSWYGDGRGDNTLSGYFNVLDVVYSNGLLVSFAADFVQYDECNVSRWNVGSIRYNSTIPVTYPAPPTLVGPFASGVTTSGALLSGAVNPNGPKTSIFFQYGLDTTYGNTTPSQTLSSATTSYAISSSLTGLFQNTTYHYRLLAISTAGVSISPDSMFTTVEIPLAPVINSSLSTTGTQGGVVSYQIAATNFPSGYGGNALPAGLFVNPATGLISGTLSQSGVFRVDITALNSRGTGHAILNIQAITPYQAWQHQIFGPKLLGDPGLSADLAAPSSDGIPNLMKYALNLTPMAVATSGLPTQGLMQDEYNNTFQTLSYTRVIAATDIAYIVEVSDDLLTWFSDDSYTTIVGATNHPDGLTQTVVVRDLRPVNDFTRHFIRLNISKP